MLESTGFRKSFVIVGEEHKLEGLNNAAGMWISDKEEMKNIVTDYFKNLFSAQIRHGTEDQNSRSQVQGDR